MPTDTDQQSVRIEDLFSVKGKTALVTGGSRGIGYMIARAYVENGATVYISARKADPCNAAAKALSAFGKCISIPSDVGTTEGRAALVTALKEREERLDILVNNAGAAWGAPFDEYPEDGWDKVMNINVKSVFMLTRDLAPMLEKAGEPGSPARVINIGSMDALHVPPLESYAYPPSKAAVHHMTRVLSVKLGDRNIAVNAIAPGPFESKMTEYMLDNFQDDFETRSPLSRIGAPADMAGAALYLASPAGAYVTGTVIVVDGGISLC
jgi:NAD(P)-dependent dehydrogenase (short-subunit alcohol dehydrogenase family)